MDANNPNDSLFDPSRVKIEVPDPSNKLFDKCSICWIEQPVNGIQLDCGHIFCFLCIKSIAESTGRCALCRAEIQIDLDSDQLDITGKIKLPSPSHDGYFWFYAGKTGWWLYDADTNQELERAHRADKKFIEKLIAGQVYVISLRKLKQFQKNDHLRSRKICRGTLEMDNILGLAGLRNRSLVRRLRREFKPNETTDLRF